MSMIMNLLLLDRRTDDYDAAFRSGDRTPDEYQVSLTVNPHDFQILGGTFLRAHVTRHFLAFEHATRGLVLTDRPV